MPNCDFNKVGLKLYWNHNLAWIICLNLQHIFRTLFPRNTNRGLLLDMDLYINDAILPPKIVFPQFQHNFLPWSLIFVFSIKSYEFWYCASSSTPYNLFRVSSDPMELNGMKKNLTFFVTLTSSLIRSVEIFLTKLSYF